MYVSREIETAINKWLDEREIIAIIGPRQSGKTTLLHHIRDQLIDESSYDRDHIIYVSFDDEIERLKFEKNSKDYIEGKLIDNTHHLFLLDEVQYLEKAGLRLKVIFDKYHDRIKFIITGSSSLDIRNISGALVGRIILFYLYPFSFPEFLSAKDTKMYRYYQKNKFQFDQKYPARELVYLDELNSLLKEYITFGGFPRIVLLDDMEKKEFLLRQLVTMYIEKDILKLYGQGFRNDALKILQYLAFHCGKLLNFENISSHLKIDIRRVNEVINILENTFLIKRIRPYYKNLTTELRKRPKIFFIDSGIRNVLAEDFVFSKEKGFLFENFVFSQLNRFEKPLKYWRTTSKAEVDFIHDGIPVEVKITPKITRSLKSYLATYSPPIAVIANYETIQKQKTPNSVVYFIPAVLL
ncbi:MAG: ATP-binding protein [Thermoplasmata archaeon]|nr:ATP-binding protein [Thermoplasmata archaeon]